MEMDETGMIDPSHEIDHEDSRGKEGGVLTAGFGSEVRTGVGCWG